MKKALITGITGQDGSYLTELLLGHGYEVFGLIRRTSSDTTSRIKHLLDKITLIQGDLLDQGSLNSAIKEIKPDEVYNLAAQSFVQTSWQEPEFTSQVTGLGVMRVLEALRNIKPDTKFYQATSSECFGKVCETPQNEDTPFYPRSPYGVSKAYGHYITVNYRESFNLFATSGILFNHESPRRGIEFVTKKIAKGVADIIKKKESVLYLGNLESKRDWGYAKDYVYWMWRMLQEDKPDTFVIGTETTHSIKEFCKLAFDYVNLDYLDYVKIDPRFYRPAEVDLLIADSSKAKRKLGYYVFTSFEDLVKLMVESELQSNE